MAREAVTKNIIYSGDRTIQYYLIIDVSKTEDGDVLFQISTVAVGTNFTQNLFNQI
jgi:hypothetical protein